MNTTGPSINSKLDILEYYAQKASAIKSGAGYYYIIWGCCLSIYVSLLLLMNREILPSNAGNWIWLLFPLSGLISSLTAKKLDGAEQATPQQDRIHKYIWIGTCLMVAIDMILFHGSLQDRIFHIACLMAMASFITGGIFAFRPATIGASVGVALGISIYLYDSYWTLLAAALCLTCSLTIPGIFMISKYPSRV